MIFDLTIGSVVLDFINPITSLEICDDIKFGMLTASQKHVIAANVLFNIDFGLEEWEATSHKYSATFALDRLGKSQPLDTQNFTNFSRALL